MPKTDKLVGTGFMTRTRSVLVMTADKIVKLPTMGFQWIAGGALVLIMVMICYSIGLRMMNQPILGVYEIAEFLMVFLVFFGIPYTQMNKRHVTMGVAAKLVEKFRPLTYSLGAIIFGLMSWQTALQGLSVLKFGQESMGLRIPVWPFYLLVALALALMCLVLLGQLIQCLLKEDSK